MSAEWQLEVGQRTDAGMLREANEDSLGTPGPTLTPELLCRKGRLYVVADGIGGHEGGKVASSLTVEQVLRGYYGDPSAKAEESLLRAIEAANQAVHEQAKDPQFAGMGTTLVAAVLQGDSLLVANVGDSRAYLVREGKISQITRDHSWVAEQRDAGHLTEEEARRHPYRNVILRSVGSKPEVQVDFFALQLRAGDSVLLCTDGLSDVAELLQVVGKHAPQAAADSLIDLANSRGGPDNSTAIVLRVGPAWPAGSPERARGRPAGPLQLLRSCRWLAIIAGLAAAVVIVVWAIVALDAGRSEEGIPVAQETAAITAAAAPFPVLMIWQSAARQPAPRPADRPAATPHERIAPRESPSPEGQVVETPGATTVPTVDVTVSPSPADVQPPALLVRPIPEAIVHTVERGEHYGTLAADYRVPNSMLIAFNEAENPDVVYPGDRIRIPLFEYVVQAGETVDDIAEYYGVPAATTLWLNELGSAESIEVGQTLHIPLPGVSLPRVHVVLSGEGLTVVAAQYGITVEALAEANDLSPGALLDIGQRLIIPVILLGQTLPIP